MAIQAANLPLEAAKIITFIDSPRDIILNIQGDTDPARFSPKIFRNNKQLSDDLLPDSTITGQQIKYHFTPDKIKALNSYFSLFIYLDDSSKFGFAVEVKSGFGEPNDQAFSVTVTEGGNIEIAVSITDQELIADAVAEMQETKEQVNNDAIAVELSREEVEANKEIVVEAKTEILEAYGSAQALTDAVNRAEEEADRAEDYAIAIQNTKWAGYWNPNTNSAAIVDVNGNINVVTLTGTPSVLLLQGSGLNVTVPGISTFAGNNFNVGQAFDVGDGLIVLNPVTYYRVPKSDLALKKVEDLQTVFIDYQHPDYVYAVTDINMRFLFGIKNDGSLEVSKFLSNNIPGSAIKDEGISISKLSLDAKSYMWQFLDPSTGYVMAILDSLDRKLIAITTSGDVELGGKSWNDLVAKVATLRTDVDQIKGAIVLVKKGKGAGDSLTVGTGGGGVTWVNVLQGLLGDGYLITNMGVGGEDVNTITARIGAVPVKFQNPFVLPADGSTVQVFTTTDNGVLNKYGKTIKPLLQGAGNSVNPCWVAGIECTLSHSSGIYYLKRNIAASRHVNIPAGETLILNGSTRKNDYFNIYFIGQNGGYDNDEDRLVEYYKDLVYYNLNSNYMLVGLHSGTRASRSSLEAKMHAAFGSHFLNWREYVSTYGLEDAGITPTTEDTTAMNAGSIPPSLLVDSVHMNAAGYTVLGSALYNRGVLLGIW